MNDPRANQKTLPMQSIKVTGYRRKGLAVFDGLHLVILATLWLATPRSALSGCNPPDDMEDCCVSNVTIECTDNGRITGSASANDDGCLSIDGPSTITFNCIAGHTGSQLVEVTRWTPVVSGVSCQADLTVPMPPEIYPTVYSWRISGPGTITPATGNSFSAAATVTNAGRYICTFTVSAPGRCPPVSETFTATQTLYSVEIEMEPYLGINMVDPTNSPVDTAVAVATVTPTSAGASYSWILGSSITLFDPGSPSGLSATIKETGNPSETYQAESVNMTLTPPGCMGDTNFTVVKIDIVMQALSEENEQSIGGYVSLNEDDDNTNGVSDLSEEPVAGEDNMVEVSIKLYPSDLPTNETFSITGYADLYEDAEKQTHALDRYPASRFPLTLWVEGKSVSSAPRDKHILVSHDSSDAKDKVQFTIIKVDLSNADAMNDPKIFQYGETTLTNPSGSDPETKNVDALVIYYNAIASYPAGAGLAVVPDFDVDLNFEPDGSEVQWSKVSGPSSGSLVDASSAHAKYRNVKRGGLYEFDTALEGGQTTRTQLWLPVAAPDISAYWQSEIDYFKNTWGPEYRTRLFERAALPPGFSERELMLRLAFAIYDLDEVGHHLDWFGFPIGVETDRRGPRSNTDSGRITICGVVVEWHKRNNMMYGLIGREMMIPEWLLTYAADPDVNPWVTGAPDTPATRTAYQVGYDLHDGVPLEAVMEVRGYGMQEPNTWAQKEWPSHETATSGLIRGAASELSAMIQ